MNDIRVWGYKPIKELDGDELFLCAQELEWCSRDFRRFLGWVKIVEPPIPGQTGGGIIPLVLWKHIDTVVDALLSKPLISILKARQIGISTILAAYHLWLTRFSEGSNLLLFSKGQPEAKELLGKSHRMYDLLPPFMKLKLDPDSTEEMGFPKMKSAIKAFPSTQSASRSYTASLVTCDEHAEHPYADENYMSSKPTRDKGGQFISVFTEDPFSNDNLATAIFTDALEGKNDFTPLFFPYDVVPGRDDEWYELTKRNIPERELSRLSPDLYMAKNYPSSIEEALSLAETVKVFDKKVINVMMDDVRGQINTDREGIDNDICHIYKDYHIGNHYIAATDVSLGVSKDYNVTTIMDVKTGDIVADIMSQFLAPEELALHSVRLLALYHNPLWWIEQNMWGRTVIKKAVELGYRRLGYRGEKPIYWSHLSDDDVGRIGFVTQDKSRTDLFGQLIPAINDHQIQIYNQNGLKQFYGIIRNARKDGKIEATSGQHDDYVIAVGICWLKKGDVKVTPFEMKPIRTLDFGNEQSALDRILAKRGAS